MDNPEEISFEEVRKKIWHGFFSNYFRLFLQLVIGLLTFRVLFQNLEAEEFGFWVLLWSILSYTKFFDFGFGLTIQKKSAELAADKDWKKLQKIIVSTFYFYLFIGLFFVSIIYLFSGFLINSLKISEKNIANFQDLLIYFFLWVGLSFPLGLFKEVLFGQHRIYIYNIIISFTTCLNFIVLIFLIYNKLGLKALFTASIFINLILVNVLAGYFALKRWPKITLNPRYFSLNVLKQNLNFSLYSYFNTIAGTLITNSDRLIISFFLNVSSLPLYQAGAKIGEQFTNVARQLGDTLSPAAAYLHVKQDKEAIKNLLLTSVRYNLLIATPLYVILALYIPFFIKFLTGLKNFSPELIWTAQILLLWNYTMIATYKIFRTIFFMCGKEKILTFIGILETFCCIALMIILSFFYRSILSIALGLFIPTSLIGWFYFWPLAAFEGGISVSQLSKQSLGSIWLGCLPMIVITYFFYQFVNKEMEISTLMTTFELLITLVVGIISIWFLTLKPNEKKAIERRIPVLQGLK